MQSRVQLLNKCSEIVHINFMRNSWSIGILLHGEDPILWPSRGANGIK